MVVEAPSAVKVVVIQFIVVDAAVHHIAATKGNIQQDFNFKIEERRGNTETNKLVDLFVCEQ